MSYCEQNWFYMLLAIIACFGINIWFGFLVLLLVEPISTIINTIMEKKHV